MAITKQGARKIAAMKAGVSVVEYDQRIKTGHKWCSGCKQWHLSKKFGKDRTRWDGAAAQCKEYRNITNRGAYVRKPGPVKGRSFIPARSGDKKQARRRINYFVEAGIIPHPNDLPCADCGDIWKEGGKRHEYDHYLGYAAKNHESVQPLCSGCHHNREIKHDG